MGVDAAIVALFLILSLVIGIISSKGISSFDRFSVGHRAFNSFIIFATLSASFIGGGYTIGNASKVFSGGMLYAFALLGFSLKEILVAKLIAPRMGKYQDCLSVGDIIEKQYGKKAKILTGIFGVLLCTGILGAQVGAMGVIFNTFLHLSALWGILIGFGIIILYSSLGGMRAVVYTDVIQFAILVIGIPLTLLIGIQHIGGVSALVAKTPPSYLFFLNTHQHIILFVSLFITFIFGETLVPPYVQRLLMSKTAKQTERGTLASGLLSIPFFLIAGGIGLVAHAMNPNIEPNQALLYVIKTALPIGIRGFVMASILAIIMSSAAGFLNAAAVSLVNDIVRPLAGKRLQDRALLVLVKNVTFLVGAGSILFALAIKNILDILLYAYNFWSPIILVPIVAVIFGINASKRDFIFGASGGIATMLIWTILLNSPEQISGVVLGVAANLILFSASNYFGRKNLVKNKMNDSSSGPVEI